MQDPIMPDQAMQDLTMPDKFERKNQPVPFPLTQLLDYHMEDQNATTMPIDAEKKENLNKAVDEICDRLFQVIGTVHVNEKKFKGFKSFVKRQVRGNLYALIAKLPPMTVNEYVNIYWENYKDLSDAALVRSSYSVFMRLPYRYLRTPKHFHQPIPLPSEPMDHEPNYKRLMKLDSVDLEIIKEMSNNHCWYIDYCLDKIMTKAYKNVTKDNFDVMETHNFADDFFDSLKTKDISTRTDTKVSTLEELSKITYEQLMEKIESHDDHHSVEKFIDTRIAKMLPQIKAEIILPRLLLFVRRFESHLTHIGLQHLQLKASRKLYYATIASQKLAADFLISTFNLIAVHRVECEALEKLDYEMRIVCTFSVNTYMKILSEHLTLFKGYRMFALKTFPEEDDAEGVHEDESEQMEADWTSHESNFTKYCNEMY